MGVLPACGMLLAYQSDSQVQTAFQDKPTLLYDNCTTQIYLGRQQHRNGGANFQKPRRMDAGGRKLQRK